MISFESPKTEILFMPIFLAAFNPTSRASYSLMLLVVSNSSLYGRGITSLVGEIKTIPAPDPYLEQAPSKNIFHTRFFAFSSTIGMIFLTVVLVI